MSRSSNAPRIAVSKLFRGRNQGSELLVGREEELAALDAAWSGEGKKNVVTIVAWGGVGKTSLVAHWAARTLAREPHGSIGYYDWSFYTQGTRREGDATGPGTGWADIFVKEALEFFGEHKLASGNAGAWQKGERLAQLVAEQRTLLILDGLEPLQDAKSGELRDQALSALLRGLASHNPGLCLITTRQRLPELNRWFGNTAEDRELFRLSDKAGAALLAKLGVDGTDQERYALSSKVKGHALTLTLLGRFLKRIHHGDIRRLDRVDFRKVNEQEQGGHAFRVVAAYERWFEENECLVEIAILRMIGLFDRPATPDCLAALRDPPIAGLTDAAALLDEDGWNAGVAHLVQLGLIEEQPYEPRQPVGFSEDVARKSMEAWRQKRSFTIGEPQPFPTGLQGSTGSIDTHPLVREHFGRGLREAAPTIWRAAHDRLYEHLGASVPYWPEGLQGLQPLYQAVVHGCQAGRYQQTCREVYINRILRETSGHHAFYSVRKLGAMGANLGAVGCFFIAPWTQLAPELGEVVQAWLFDQAANYLRALGRLTEARGPMRSSLEMSIQQSDWIGACMSECSLSDLDVALGDLVSAVTEGERSVGWADRADNLFGRLSALTYHANALHQAGQIEAARRRFEEAEAVQKGFRYPQLNSLAGFLFCELLMVPPERSAWIAAMEHELLSGTRSPKEHERGSDHCSEALNNVEQRCLTILEWRIPGYPVLDVALGQLTLARVAIYGELLEHSSRSVPISVSVLIDSAVLGLRQSGNMDDLPRGLLTRAWLRAQQGQTAEACEDLSEAQQIAERGPMPIYLADVHLHRARLFFRDDRDGAREDLKKARELIFKHGYLRRKEELEDAEKVIFGAVQG